MKKKRMQALGGKLKKEEEVAANTVWLTDKMFHWESVQDLGGFECDWNTHT